MILGMPLLRTRLCGRSAHKAAHWSADHRECLDYLSVAANLIAAAAPCVCATFFTRARLAAGRPRRSPMYCPWILRTATGLGAEVELSAFSCRLACWRRSRGRGGFMRNRGASPDGRDRAP